MPFDSMVREFGTIKPCCYINYYRSHYSDLLGHTVTQSEIYPAVKVC